MRGDVLKIKYCLLIAVFVISSIRLNASSISPELEIKLKKEGKWDQFVTTLQKVNQRGINIPNKNAVKFNEIDTFGKTTVYLNALVILVDFSDHLADTLNHNPPVFEHLLFSEGVHSTGSMNDFYLENSYNNVGVTGVVTLWLRMPQNYTYYVNGQGGLGNYPNNAQKLTEDAVAAADPIVNFSQFDNDNDGYVDALFVVHAGVGRESSGSNNDIHSHAWSITGQVRDGVVISSYSMEPELHNTSGTMVRMGVFGHEFGHVLGLPDLYDTDYSSRGLGSWSMMAGGSWNGGGLSPSHFDAWSKYQLGWVSPVNVDNDSVGVNIPSIEDTAISYIIWTEGQLSSEYFIVENRQQIGFDSYIPSSGLLIYHIDESVSGNSNDWHPLVMLEQADGLFDLQNNSNSGDSGDPFPGQTSNTIFDGNTLPNSKDYNDNLTFVSVSNIVHSSGVITADFGVDVNFPILFMTYPSIIDSTGDNEGDADPGETIFFTLQLENIGAATDSVLVEIVCSDTQVVWLDSIEFVANLNGNDIITLDKSFQASFSTQMFDPTYVIFEVMVTYPNGSFNDYFTVLVGDNPGFSSNIEGDTRIWKHYNVTNGYNDEWHVESYRNHTTNGLYSFKMGGSGTADYSDLDDSALESPDIEIGQNSDAVLSFYQIIFAEEEFGTGTAWDGGVVELSDNGGLTWQIIYPEGGYSHTIIDNPASPFMAGTPVFSGVDSSWQEKRFDLSAFTGVVKIRFRFGSDGFVTDEGWYIDDVSIENTLSGADTYDEDINKPYEFSLLQNYPNPFNPSTTFEFSIPKSEHVTLKIYDLLGKEVATLISENKTPGSYKYTWNAGKISSGVYLYKIQAGEFVQTRKLVLMK
jgi:immune inhibitor A